MARIKRHLLQLGADEGLAAAIVEQVQRTQAPAALAELDKRGPEFDRWFETAAEGLLRCHEAGGGHGL